MNTCLFTPSYLDGVDPLGTDRFYRNVRYLNYYLKLKEKLGFNRIEFADNASSMHKVNLLKDLFQRELTIFRYAEHLGKEKQPHDNDYNYVWRAFYHIEALFNIYDKVILIDSDTFIVSPQMARYIRNCEKGWETFWIPMYDFASAEIQILNRDALQTLKKFVSTPYEKRNGTLMEKELPYTKINRNFVGNRYGELRLQQPKEADFYSQAPGDIDITWNLKGEL